jgi:hypothetical protein
MLTGERAWMLDTIQRAYSDDGHGDGHLTLEGLVVVFCLAPGSESPEAPEVHIALAAGLPLWGAFLSPSRREETDWVNSIYAQYQARAAQPLWVVLHASDPVGEDLRGLHASAFERLRRNPLGPLMPDLDFCIRSDKRGQAVGQALAVAVALEVYHRHHGQYPATLTELVPQCLPTAPLDESTGQPLLYKVRGGKPLLYGRGLDGTDHGGICDDSRAWPRVPKTGDWVLYPPPSPAPAKAGPTTRPAPRR